MPAEKLIYVADSKYAPYGNLSAKQITQRVNTICDQLVAKNVKAIVIACNTATVNAIDQLRTRLNIPIIGVEPAIKPAAALSKTKSVGLLVTQATASNQRFLNLINTHKNGAEVHIQPCPQLADIIEQGRANTLKSKQLLQQYLAPLIEKKIDTLVLGCTHYPFVAKQIQEIIGDGIQLLETAKPVTFELKRQLAKLELLARNDSKPNKIMTYSSAPSVELDDVMKALWDYSSIEIQPSLMLI